ncbi:MAG: transglycosylase domain-containing protein [Methyloceanibacter sp.]|uniref:transglycosylase domain-containing protein n=1 Tax=Methyloceanibacter sp. TaxID=1965321 RepID=UPI003EE05FA7
MRRAGRRGAAALSVLLTGFLVTGGLVAVPFLILTAPVDDYSLTALEPASQRTLVLHTSDGKPFARRGGCVAEPVSLDEVPQHFVDALLSMEDRRFYYHLGIDPIGLARAAMENRAAGRIVQGGSTITQQLAKYSLLSSDRTMERKRKEAWLALSLELRLSKDEILERYLSSAYFGQGCYGLRAAAKQYFGTTVPDLTLPQSAYLVALLKSPTALNRDPEAARQRGNEVLDAMVETRKVSPARRKELAPVLPEIRTEDATGSYYADWVSHTIELPRTSDYSPLPVYTAFDPELQRLAESAIETVLAKEGKARNVSQAAMVVMRPDGRVLAMVGGADHDQSQFNRAVQARRQPGSSFKLFVYLAALRAGLTPNSTVVDQPVRIGSYEPKNFGHRYRGAMPMSRAFASSINTVSVQLSEGMRRTPVITAARDLGISTPLEAQPSLALGAFEVTLLEMTSAFAAVDAGAYPVKPWAITGFEAADANSAPPRGAGRWRLNEQKELMTLLRGTVESGSGRRARLPIRAFGKTGTSQDYRDAWFIGFAGNLVVGVWVGNDDFKPMKRVTGGSLPAEIWVSFMREAIETDKGFERKPQRIAAFEAELRQRKVKIAKNAFNQGEVEKPRKRSRAKRRRDFDFSQDRRPRRERRGLFGGLFR